MPSLHVTALMTRKET